MASITGKTHLWRVFGLIAHLILQAVVHDTASEGQTLKMKRAQRTWTIRAFSVRRLEELSMIQWINATSAQLPKNDHSQLSLEESA